MRGIAGTVEYLNTLYELYDAYESLGTVCVLETVRLADVNYEEAAEYWEAQKEEKDRREFVDRVHNHLEGRIGEGR